MRDLNLLSQFSNQCLSKRHICDVQFADVAWALKTQTAINQAWPNAVFGLRPRLFFLLIPCDEPLKHKHTARCQGGAAGGVHIAKEGSF